MNFIQIENKAARVKLDEVVDDQSMGEILEEIGRVYGAQAFDSGRVSGEITNFAENAADTLEIDIHSPGGSVLDGYKLYNELLELRERGVEVTARITLAASMASVIAMAADRILMKKGGRMMIHEASGGAHGDAAELQRTADLLESISDEIAGIYSDRTGIDQSEVRDMMRKETWMNSAEAIALGFADIEFDTKNKTKPKAMSILDKLTNPSSEEAREQIAALENAAEAHDAQIQEFQAKVEYAENALQEAVTEVAAIKNDRASMEGELAEAKAEIETLKARVAQTAEESSVVAEELAEKVEELEEAAVETSEKVEAKAAELLAATGHPEPVAIEEEGDDSHESIKAQFKAMKPGAERSAFFQAHKDVLSIL